MGMDHKAGIKNTIRKILRTEVGRIEAIAEGGRLSEEDLNAIQTIVRTYGILETKIPAELPKPKDKLEKSESDQLIKILKKSTLE